MFRGFLSERGFTFQEILVVVVVIGVIASFAVPAGMGMMNDTTTREFATNAKVLEDAAHVHYRDTGVLPVAESVGSGELVMSEKSKLVIRNELIKAGITDSATILNNLIADGHVRLLKFDELVGYSTVSKNQEGSDDFVIIDMIEDIDASRYGVYENDIAGFVFSMGTRDTSSNETYSGAYKIDSGVGEADLDDKEVEITDAMLADASSLKPYGFRVANVKNNKDGTADVTLAWTTRLTELVEGSEQLKRGYVSEEFTLTCSTCSSTTQTFVGGTIETVLEDVPLGNVRLTLRGDKVVFSGKTLSGVTRIANVNDTADGDIDLLDVVTNPGEGVVSVNPDLDEVLEGDQFDNRDDLYKELEENENFGPNRVTAVRDGLSLTNIVVGDRIVLKEIRKTGNLYDYDKNRTRLFIAKNTTVLIPKDPYLQKDFQTNPYSEYQYIVEVYKNVPCGTCAGKTAPDRAAVVYYE